MNDIQLARDAGVDLEEQLVIAQQQQTSEQINQHLADMTSGHPIAAITGSHASSSSFDLSRELAATSPPTTPGSSPVPIGDTPGVSPIPKSPPLDASSPPTRTYTRKMNTPGSSTETRDPETSVPKGKQVQAKPRGIPPGSTNKI